MIRSVSVTNYTYSIVLFSFKVSNGNVLTLTPPLTITDQEMDKAICIIKAAFQKAQSL